MEKEICSASLILASLSLLGMSLKTWRCYYPIFGAYSQNYFEIIVCDELADKLTNEVVQRNSAILHRPESNGYGSALLSGFELAQGNYIITMDADLSHPAEFIEDLWENRDTADVIIASRYIRGGRAIMPLGRWALSYTLNFIFSRGLDLRIRDMSSGFRMYRATFLKNRKFTGENFNILQELLVSAYVDGFQIREIPFTYQPRKHGVSHARILRFGIDYLKTLPRLWLMRNSIASADYDHRSYFTWFIPQRYWQRKRFHIISKLIRNQSTCLDAGCGSSIIISGLPSKSIALDIKLSKLRYARIFHKQCLNASVNDLPLSSQSLPCVICSQVIEHIPRGKVLGELDRVLTGGGLLILGTPDYSKWQWVLTEKIYKIALPQAYADEHITHYTFQELVYEFVNLRGYTLETSHYILQGELILALRKPNHILNGE
jgi:dolichol-phosphate mannosyltransferase